MPRRAARGSSSIASARNRASRPPWPGGIPGSPTGPDLAAASARLDADDDADRGIGGCGRLRTIERAAIESPADRPVALGRIETAGAQLLDEDGRRLVDGRRAAVLDEDDHAEVPVHAGPFPGLRHP